MKTAIEGWGGALERKDPGTWGRCKRVAAFATVLAHALRLDDEEVRAIECGALLHEIGKLEIPITWGLSGINLGPFGSNNSLTTPHTVHERLFRMLPSTR